MQGLHFAGQSHDLRAQSNGALKMNGPAPALGATRDTNFMAVNEAIALGADAMEQNHPETLMFISLSGDKETAILGGQVDSKAIERLQSLVDELKRRAKQEGETDKVLHVWR